MSLLFPISLQKSKFAVRDRVIEFALEKKDSGPYWKRLVKEDQKQHWLKVDFNKWKDEDESDDEAGGGQDLEEVKKMIHDLLMKAVFSVSIRIFNNVQWPKSGQTFSLMQFVQITNIIFHSILRENKVGEF